MYIQLQNFGIGSSIKTINYEGKYECIERLHQFPEIVCVFDGEVHITVDGKQEIAKRGDMAVITPFRTHSFYTPDYVKLWIGVISNNFISHFTGSSGIYMSGERAVFTPTVSLFNYVSEHIPRKYEKPTKIEGNTVLYNSVMAISTAIFEEYTRLVPSGDLSFNKSALSDILLYLSEHYLEPISLISLSEKIGYTPTYISHCISAIPNMNFRKLLNSLRVDRAKQLLAEGNLKMIDIALESGFNCERTMRRAFTELCGKLPSEYKTSKD